MARRAEAFVVFCVAITQSWAFPVLGSPLVLDSREDLALPSQPLDSGTTHNTPAMRLRWSAGLRAQAFYASDAWTELGADAMVFPWRHLGVGITALQNAGNDATDCGSEPKQPCGPYWRSVAPFVEARLLPNFWLSPYARGAFGVAWGNFTGASSTSNTAAYAYASRAEFGADLHYGASLRLYLAVEHLGYDHTNLDGFGGGFQVGLTL